MALGTLAFLFVIAILLWAWFDFWSIRIKNEKTTKEIKIGDLESQSNLMPSEGLTPKSKSPDSGQKINSNSLRKRITTPSSNQIKRSLRSQISTKTVNPKKFSIDKEIKSSSRSITFSGHELERTFSGLDREQITELHWDFKPLS